MSWKGQPSADHEYCRGKPIAQRHKTRNQQATISGDLPGAIAGTKPAAGALIGKRVLPSSFYPCIPEAWERLFKPSKAPRFLDSSPTLTTSTNKAILERLEPTNFNHTNKSLP